MNSIGKFLLFSMVTFLIGYGSCLASGTMNSEKDPGGGGNTGTEGQELCFILKQDELRCFPLTESFESEEDVEFYIRTFYFEYAHLPWKIR